MSGKDLLDHAEGHAISGGESSLYTGVGKTSSKKGGFFAKFGAPVLIFGVFAILFGLVAAGNFQIGNLSSKFNEATNIQHANAVQSKQVVIQEALKEGKIPNNTADIMSSNNAEVGYMENGEFVKDNNSGRDSVIRYKDKIITSENFLSAVNSDPGLYDVVNKATYSDAAYYYDSAANRVYKSLGVSRNSYTKSDESFDEVMSKAVGEGSSIEINSATYTEERNNKGEIVQDFQSDGSDASSKSSSSTDFINSVKDKNKASTPTEATMNTASSLNTADTISKQQRSISFFMAFMENISKTMAGEGNESRINDAMNYLYEERTSNVVDVETGETTTVTGAMINSPSVYAVLSDSKLDSSKVKNYSSDRILTTVNSKNGGNNINNNTISGTVASTNNKVRGAIGRVTDGNEPASDTGLSNVATTVQNSLIDNSFETIGGVEAGEMLVDGAINLGKALAKASGATPGDEASVKEYAALTAEVLAMDAKVDRMNRSPFDVTSRNTFLGSIIWNMAINMNNNSIMKAFGSVLRTTGVAINKLSLSTYADDMSNLYYATAGTDCYTANSIGAMGWANGNTAVTFATDVKNLFSDAGFESFVEANTTINGSGERTITKGSTLGKFILYNDEKLTTPDGIVDAGVLDSIQKGSSKIPFISNVIGALKSLFGASESDIKMATGEAFLNSPENPDWSTYKYAQAYVSLARAQDNLRQYDGDVAAYSDLKFFEGTRNPVIAFLEENDAIIAQH